MKRLTLVRTACVLAALCFGPGAHAQSVEDFYKGKDIRLLIGADVGGSYGLYAQLAARHMRLHIPGKPNIIVQNMPGAGGNIAMNYSYGVAPKDGSLMHLMHAEVLFETLLTSGVKFNAANYQWIGRFADADGLALATKKSGVRNLEDARRREVTMGATGVTNVFALTPMMLNRLSGTKFRIIGGYKGTSDIYIAMERGEVDGAGVTSANVAALHQDQLTNGDLTPLFIIGAKRSVEFPDAPAITEFGSGTEKTLLEIYASSGPIGRALAFPPGVPADRVEALRTAFAATLIDPAFQAEVSKSNIPIAPMAGKEIAAFIASVMGAPAAQIDAARKLHEELIKSAN